MQNQQNEQKQTSWAVIAVIIIAIAGAVIYWFMSSQITNEQPKQDIIVEAVVEENIPTQPELLEPEFEEEIAIIEEVEIVEPEVVLPTLEESDNWLLEKLPSLTWRKELIKLMLTDDMIRRFVVFTDNFSQGSLAYEHSPLVKPNASFSAIETNSPEEGTTWQWDESSARRFSLYVDLIRSMDSEMLVQWYVELKPLIDEAYQELGYPDEDFTDVLQSAITKVLDMEIPKSAPILERPSVMYRYKDEDMELQDDADKLLLRLGKENLLVIKSVLLEINEKLARTQ
jgi:hypothetical protein